MLAPTTENLDVKQLRELVRRVDAGDEEAIVEFREQLQNPLVVEQFGGDLPGAIQRTVFDRFKEVGQHAEMALATKLRTIRESLALPTESPLLQLLAERVSICWLHVYFLEWLASGRRDPWIHQLLHQLVDRVHRRYLSALKTLAEVRRLNLPAIQVNVAQQQVVVGSVVGSAERPPR